MAIFLTILVIMNKKLAIEIIAYIIPVQYNVSKCAIHAKLRQQALQ